MKRKIGEIYQPVVYYPSVFEDQKYTGDLTGFYHEETNEYNIVNFDIPDKTKIGEIVLNKPKKIPENNLLGFWENDQLFFFQGNNLCKKNPFDLLMNVFSRNSGLLETNKMLEKRAIIAGVGSVGSLIALELARSGVGHFLLIDIDTLAYHNICRHQLGIKDVGRFKVTAVKEKILQINPSADVIMQNVPIESVGGEIFDSFISGGSIIIGCIDNIEGDLYANRISKIYNIPFISIGLWERAFAGEIIYSIPGKTPCYECIVGGKAKTISSNRVNQNHRFYTNEEHLEDAQFEPGISVDINFVTEIGIKLIIDILNRNESEYIPKLINYLTQFTLVCNTNDRRIGREHSDLFSEPLQVTTSIEPDYYASCSACKIQK
jgi:molybdopterin/thiamine biosynthesis adenylyltransferase